MIHLCLTSDPTKLNQVRAVWAQKGEAWMCLCAWRTPAYAEWQVWTVPGTTGLMEGSPSLLSFSYPAGHVSVHVFTIQTWLYWRLHDNHYWTVRRGTEEITVAQTVQMVFRVVTRNSPSSSGSCPGGGFRSEGQTEARWPAQGDHCQGSGAGLTPLGHTWHQVNNLLTGNPACQTPARHWRQTADPRVSSYTHTHAVFFMFGLFIMQSYATLCNLQ